MKTGTAIAIGFGVGVVVGAVAAGGVMSKQSGCALKHKSYAIGLWANKGALASEKATVFLYPELNMSVIKIPPCKIIVSEPGSDIISEAIPAGMVSDAAVGMTFPIPAHVFGGSVLGEGEYIVAKVHKNDLGGGSITFSLATNKDNEKQDIPLRAGTYEVTSQIIITWEAK